MTYHYTLLNALKNEYSGRGVEILGLPCNQFLHQEPGAVASEILNGIKHVRPGGGYEPNFNLTEKIEVNGANRHPIFAHLTENCPYCRKEIGGRLIRFYDPIRVNDVRWNFEKYLVDKKGIVRFRYHTVVEPTDDLIKQDIDALLAEN